MPHIYACLGFFIYIEVIVFEQFLHFHILNIQLPLSIGFEISDFGIWVYVQILVVRVVLFNHLGKYIVYLRNEWRSEGFVLNSRPIKAAKPRVLFDLRHASCPQSRVWFSLDHLVHEVSRLQ